MATKVKRFLEQLPEPCLTAELSSELSSAESRSAIRAMNPDDAAAAILCRVVALHEPYKSTSILLLEHFRRVVANRASNGCTASELAAIFAHLLLCPRAVQGVVTNEAALMDWHIHVISLIFACNESIWIRVVKKSGTGDGSLSIRSNLSFDYA